MGIKQQNKKKMLKKINYHKEKLKFYWKDNKVVFGKHISNMTKCGIKKISNILREKKESEKFRKKIEGKKEITLEINYAPGIKSSIILPTADEGLTKDLLLHGMREPAEVELFIKELKGTKLNVVDIGANLGFYLLLEPHLTSGNIYGIEPNPKSYEYLIRSVKLNKFDKIKTFNMGIGKEKGKIPFYISKKWNWCRFTKGGEDIVEVKNILVDSLNNLFKKEKIDVVRMDVEGYEVEILNGMTDHIKNNPDLKVFMEYHADMFNTKERMEFAQWLKDHRLRIKYLVNSEKDRKMKIEKDVKLSALKNLNSDYCVVLEKEK